MVGTGAGGSGKLGSNHLGAWVPREAWGLWTGVWAREESNGLGRGQGCLKVLISRFARCLLWGEREVGGEDDRVES